jgi:DNA-binding response OmpR family regulator
MEQDRGRLLIVEDDETIRLMLARYFRSRGLEVLELPDGSQVLDQLAEHPFDLVILDSILPGASGLEVLEAIRLAYPATALPVIMATSRGQSDDVVEALRLGANDYLIKPFDFSVALARVQTQLALKRSVERITALERSLAERNSALEAANGELVEANHRMRGDLEAAAAVQQALLPPGRGRCRARTSPGASGPAPSWPATCSTSSPSTTVTLPCGCWTSLVTVSRPPCSP